MKGFTLIEMLVALSITAMVFASLGGVLPSFLRTSEDLGCRIRNEDALNSCLSVIRNDLRGADPRLFLGRSEDLKLQTPNERIAIPSSHGLRGKRGMSTAVYRLGSDGSLLRAETDDFVLSAENLWEPVLQGVESLTMAPFPDAKTRGTGSFGLQIRLLFDYGSEKRLVTHNLILEPGKVVRR